MMNNITFVASIVLVLLSKNCSCDVTTSATKLHDAFGRIKEEGMGLGLIQEHLNAQRISASTIDGEDVIEKMSEELETVFSQVFGAVRAIKDTVENLYSRQAFDASGFHQCCHVNTTDLENNPVFSAPTGTRICYRVSPDSPANPLLPISEELDRVMRDNSGYDMVTWQYFSTEAGIHVKYPRAKDPRCDSYDPRFRPWYAEVATPEPKDIVIAIDRSNSMAGAKLELTKSAVLTLLGTLNPKDRVGLIVFSNNADAPPGNRTERCYAGFNFAFAIRDVIDYLKSYVNNIEVGGSIDYVTALEKSFKYFRNVANDPDDTGREKGLLLLTDGESVSPGPVLNKLKELNAEQNNQVKILTYALGNDLEEEAEMLLRDMANMTVFDESAGERKIGKFTHINDTENLRYQFASYYNEFTSIDPRETPIVTTPYIDFSGLGHITSVCLPVHDTSRILKGVTCIDTTIRELTSSFVHFQGGENAYAFVIENTGRTLIHPRLPKPGSKFDTRPLIMDIEVLEPEASQRGIIDEMKSLRTGQENIDTALPESRGNASIDGVNARRMAVTYHYRPVENTNFSVCLVITSADKSMETNVNEFDDDFIYHRVDLQDHLSTCVHADMEVIQGKSAVKLAPFAFDNPTEYRNTRETREKLERYQGFMEGQIELSIRDGVRDIVFVTKGMEQIWKQSNLPMKWVYHYFFASINGVIRMYPGSQLTQAYDHTLQQWYIKTNVRDGKLTFSTLHDSEFSGRKVITISQTMKTNGGSSQSIIGVAGMQVDLEFISETVKAHITECKEMECILIDDSGFAIFHPKLQNQWQRSVSIADLEPDIAVFLLRNNHMQQLTCDDFAWKRKYHTFKMTLQYPIDHMNEEPALFISPIYDSNTFIIIKNYRQSSLQCESCFGEKLPFECPSSFRGVNCFCPCFTNLTFHHCNNSFRPEDVNSNNPCTVSLTNADQIREEVAQTTPPAGLESCFSYQCDEMEDDWTCSLLGRQCEWCSSNSKCVTAGSCKGPSSDKQKGGTNVGAIAAPVVMILLLSICGAVLFILWRKNMLCSQLSRNKSDNDPYTDFGYVTSSSSMGHTSETSLSGSDKASMQPNAAAVSSRFQENRLPPHFHDQVPPNPCNTDITNLRSSYIQAPSVSDKEQIPAKKADYLTQSDVKPPVQQCRYVITQAHTKQGTVNPGPAKKESSSEQLNVPFAGVGATKQLVDSTDNPKNTDWSLGGGEARTSDYFHPIPTHFSPNSDGDYTSDPNKSRNFSVDLEKAKIEEEMAGYKRKQIELEMKKAELEGKERGWGGGGGQERLANKIRCF